MNNRGYPGLSPAGGGNMGVPGSPGNYAPSGGPLRGIGIGFLNAAIRETEDRPGRPRPLRFPKIPYSPPVGRLPWGTNPFFRFGRLAFDLGSAYGGQWLPGQQETWEDVMSRNGWTLQCSISPLVNQYKYTSCRGGGNNCVTPNEMGDCSVGCGWTGQVPDGQTADGINIPAEQLGGCGSVGGNWRKDIMYLGYGDTRMTLHQKWERTRLCRCSGTPVVPDDIVIPTPKAKPPIWLDDMPTPDIPIRMIPRLKDNPHRHTGPRDRKRPRWHPHWDPPFRKPGKPPFGKEKKTEPSRWEKALWAIWSAASEVPDWVDAFWDAFPEWFQKKHYFAPGYLTVDVKVKLMLENLHLMDIEVAIKNVLHNLGEDALAGKIIGLLDSVGVGVGFNGIPFLKNPHTGMWN